MTFFFSKDNARSQQTENIEDAIREFRAAVADDGMEYVVLEYVAPIMRPRPPRPTIPPGSMPTLEDGTPAL